MKRLPPRPFLLLVAAVLQFGISAFAAEPFNTPQNSISITVEPAKEVTLAFASAPGGTFKPVGRGSALTFQGGTARVKLEANGTAAFQN